MNTINIAEYKPTTLKHDNASTDTLDYPFILQSS